IDELAYVLETGDRSLYPTGFQPSAVEEQILEDLPALLRAQQLRKVLVGSNEGIVTRVARHVLGQRETLQEDQNLRWKSDDLKFKVSDSSKAGKEAASLALMLLEDDGACEAAAAFLNRAQPSALKKLLRFRSGDMKAALAEIRRDLLLKGKDL